MWTQPMRWRIGQAACLSPKHLSTVIHSLCIVQCRGWFSINEKWLTLWYLNKTSGVRTVNSKMTCTRIHSIFCFSKPFHWSYGFQTSQGLNWINGDPIIVLKEWGGGGGVNRYPGGADWYPPPLQIKNAGLGFGYSGNSDMNILPALYLQAD